MSVFAVDAKMVQAWAQTLSLAKEDDLPTLIFHLGFSGTIDSRAGLQPPPEGATELRFRELVGFDVGLAPPGLTRAALDSTLGPPTPKGAHYVEYRLTGAPHDCVVVAGLAASGAVCTLSLTREPSRTTPVASARSAALAYGLAYEGGKGGAGGPKLATLLVEARAAGLVLPDSPPGSLAWNAELRTLRLAPAAAAALAAGSAAADLVRAWKRPEAAHLEDATRTLLDRVQTLPIDIAGLREWLEQAPALDGSQSRTWPTLEAHVASFVERLEMLLGGLQRRLAVSADFDPGAALRHAGARKVRVADNVPVGITVDIGTLLARADQLLASPLVEEVTLVDGLCGRVAELAALPRLAHVAALRIIDQKVTDADVETLVRSPFVRALRFLDLTQNDVTERGVDAIAAATGTHLPALLTVGLQLNAVADPSDQQEYYDETNTTMVPTDAGRALEARFGPLRWLHALG